MICLFPRMPDVKNMSFYFLCLLQYCYITNFMYSFYMSFNDVTDIIKKTSGWEVKLYDRILGFPCLQILKDCV